MISLKEKLLARVREVDTSHESACWEWQGARTSKGYGQIYYNRTIISTHRASWLVHHGLIPDGYLILHKCDNPPCCNPDHLLCGTSDDNVKDMLAKNRDRLRGEDNGLHKLTETEVKEILLLIKENRLEQIEIASRYKVTAVTICDIKYKRTWAHIQ